MIIREHVWDVATGTICTVCGGRKKAGFAVDEALTCIQRDIPDLAPEPTGRRAFAADDADTISTRLAELRAERDAAMNEPAAVQPPGLSGTEFDLGDCCI